jgi:hypothetical protein
MIVSPLALALCLLPAAGTVAVDDECSTRNEQTCERGREYSEKTQRAYRCRWRGGRCVKVPEFTPPAIEKRIRPMRFGNLD